MIIRELTSTAAARSEGVESARISRDFGGWFRPSSILAASSSQNRFGTWFAGCVSFHRALLRTQDEEMCAVASQYSYMFGRGCGVIMNLAMTRSATVTCVWLVIVLAVLACGCDQPINDSGSGSAQTTNNSTETGNQGPSPSGGRSRSAAESGSPVSPRGEQDRGSTGDQPADEPTESPPEPVWVLKETVINPDKQPTEFLGGGATPGYFGEPRFKGKREKFSASETSFSVENREVDRDYEYHNVTINARFDKPGEMLVPGETVELKVNFSHGGTVKDGIGIGALFWYTGNGVSVQPKVASGYAPWNPQFDGKASATYSFKVPPATENGEFEIWASLWNVPPCKVVWRYQSGEGTPTPRPERMSPEPEAGSIIALDAIDGNPALHDQATENIPPSVLIRSDLTRRGTTADGTSALILRAQVSEDVPVVFHVREGRGTLEPMFGGQTKTLQDKHYAFARYTPPDSFARSGEPAPQVTVSPPQQRLGQTGPECEDLLIQATPSFNGRAGTIRQAEIIELKLARPPVVLIHGLASNPVQCWFGRLGEDSSLYVLLENTGFVPFLVNYARTNGCNIEDPLPGRSSRFASNWNVVWDSPDGDYSVAQQAGWLRDETGWLIPKPPPLPQWQRPQVVRFGGIQAALEHYRDELGLAATQADVIGHSMGGLLARAYASERYHPDDQPTYRRLDNFDQGDIHRLITLNTPHFGSELTEMTGVLHKGRIGEESITAWTKRYVISQLFRFLFNPDAGALTDLTPESVALKQIGETNVPSYAIATSVHHGQLHDPIHDPGGTYITAYSGIGMLLFNNDGVLNEAIERRVSQWKVAGANQMNSQRDPDRTGPYAVKVDFSTPQGVEAYRARIREGLDAAAYHWCQYREAAYRTSLQEQIDGTQLLRFGLHDPDEAYGSTRNEFIGLMSRFLLGGDVQTMKSADVAPDIPHEVVDMIRSLIFCGDPANDGAVRVVSQLGGLQEPRKGENYFPNMVHSFAPWEIGVQRQVIRLLRWEDHRFERNGFPPAGQKMQHWLPVAAFSKAREDGQLAVDWSGMVRSHAEQFQAIADQQNVVILGRPVNQDSTPLIEQGAATKGMAIKGKSSNWGPQRGLIPVKQRYSKLWRTKSGAVRDADIKKYDGVNQKVLAGMKYPHDPLNPGLEGRLFAVRRPLVVSINGKEYDVLIDPVESDAENEVFLHADGKLYDWRTGYDPRADDGNSNPNTPPAAEDSGSPSKKTVFDRNVTPTGEITGEQADRVLNQGLAMEVLADGLSDVPDPKPYLTADYDLLAIGYRRNDGQRGPLEEPNTAFHELRGFISPRQSDLLKDLNKAVQVNTGYRAGNVSHHGPEVQYGDSPYVDYPVLVFDPGTPAQGDAETFIIRQGPVGFRDIHLKRYFAEKNRQGFTLCPNRESAGWAWEHFRRFSLDGGYDPRDAPHLKAYVAEQPKPVDPR